MKKLINKLWFWYTTEVMGFIPQQIKKGRNMTTVFVAKK